LLVFLPVSSPQLALCKILLGSLLEFSLMLANGQKGQINAMNSQADQLIDAQVFHFHAIEAR